jgi:hypothetical protein
MSAEIVNLRLARKRRDRSAREEQAAQNRLSFGETKAERERKRLLADKAGRDLDAHRREPLDRDSDARDDTP